MEKISVIVPVYNAKKYLGDCVKSLLAQEDEDFEILLVDDASTDGSSELADELAVKDKRIRVLHPGHFGAAGARNRGIENASGELICFVDSDDTVEPCYLSFLRSMLDESGADIAACGHDKPVRGEEKKRHSGCSGCGHCAGCHARVYEGDDALKALLYQKDMMSVPWGYLYKRSLWDGISFPEGTEAEDMGTIYRLFMKADKVICSGKVCYHYIQDKNSTIYTTQASRNRAYYRHSREMVSAVRKERPGCIKAAVGRHFSACAQILSEMPLNEKSVLKKRVYDDIARMRSTVAKDKEGRIKNRAASLAAGVNVHLLHLMVRAAYRASTLRLM
ncbi:MAG: glycosyltransferase [Lachnospiraceae bacterium]|nr:glycosyltransferase [Lachnospiraceae bacterium]